jgi:hypothetical protein
MSGIAATIRASARGELRGLLRSRRAALLAIPPVAGPLGSLIADRYLQVPTASLALVLGLLIAGGLAAMVLLDLVALAAGEELARDAHLLFFSLPEPRGAQLAGRLLVAAGAPLLSFGAAAGLVDALSAAGWTGASGGGIALFDPGHLFLGVLALLLLLAGVTSAAAVIGRGPAAGIVAGVLAGVLVAAVVTYMLVMRTLGMYVPATLALAGVVALGAASDRYARLTV